MRTAFQQRPISKRMTNTATQLRLLHQQQAQSLFAEGKTQQSSANYEKAIQLYHKAISYDSGCFKSYCNLGSCYRAIGDFQQAVCSYKTALAIQPNDSISHYNIGNIFRLLGDAQKAIQHYVIVLQEDRQDSLNLDALINLGITYINIGQNEKAIECYEKAAEINQEESVVFNHAMCLLTILKRKETKEFVEVWKVKGSRARMLFERTLEINAGNLVARLALVELGYILEMNQDNVRKAEIEFHHFLRQCKENDEKEEIQKRLEDCRRLLREYEESKNEKQKAEERKEGILKKTVKKKKQKDDSKNKQERKLKVQRKQSIIQNKQDKLQLQTLNKQSLITSQEKRMLSEEKQLKKKDLYSKQGQQQAPRSIMFQEISQSISPTEISAQSTIVPTKTIQKLTYERGLSLIESNQLYTLSQELPNSDTSATKLELTILCYHSQSIDDPTQLPLFKDYYYQQFHIESPNYNTLFQSLHLQTHKAIANLLITIEEYPQAIQHYQYLLRHLSNSSTHQQQKYSLHISLAESYQYLNLHAKALQEYQNALACSEDQYILLYNIGCCLVGIGEKERGVERLKEFLQRVGNDHTVQEAVKNIYIAECTVEIAMLMEGRTDELELFQKAVTKLQLVNYQLSSEQKQRNLVNFDLRLSELYQSQIQHNHHFSAPNSLKPKLLQVYQRLLLHEQLPDREAILINCGNINYQLGLYSNALSCYTLVSDESIVINSLALTYFHLKEKMMAIKCIKEAKYREGDNLIVRTNWEIIGWAYGQEETNAIQLEGKQLEEMCLTRVQYGIVLVDRFTQLINRKNWQIQSAKTVQNILSLLIQDQTCDLQMPESKSLSRVLKSQFLKNYSQSFYTLSPTNQNKELLQLCCLPGRSVSSTCSTLLKNLEYLPNSKQRKTLLRACLSIFIYKHRNQEEIVNTLFTARATQKRQIMHLAPQNNSYATLTITEFTGGLSRLMSSLVTWQCQLQEQITHFINRVELAGYRNQLRAPIQVEYHIPKHCLYRECTATFKKISELVSCAFGIQSAVSCNQGSYASMRSSIISQYEKDFNTKIKQYVVDGVLKVSLKENFLPVTLHIFLYSKQNTQQLVNELAKQFGIQDEQVQIAAQTDELSLIIGKLVRVRCVWQQPGSLRQQLLEFIDKPFSILIQSVLNLQDSINFLCELSTLAQEFISTHINQNN